LLTNFFEKVEEVDSKLASASPQLDASETLAKETGVETDETKV
jgi:hypothetical protein